MVSRGLQGCGFQGFRSAEFFGGGAQALYDKFEGRPKLHIGKATDMGVIAVGK